MKRATALRRCAAVALLLAVGLPPAARGGEAADDPAARGFEHLGEGRFAEAASSLGRALEAEPSSEPLRSALARAWAGLAADRLRDGRLVESREALRSAVGLAPAEAGYHVLLAQVLFRQNELREARRAVDEALELAPGSASS